MHSVRDLIMSKILEHTGMKAAFSSLSTIVQLNKMMSLQSAL